MAKVNIMVILCVMACNKPIKKTQFYKSLNSVTLQPQSVSFDTLSQPPYVKVDSLSNNQLLLTFVPTKTYDYKMLLERYGNGWLNRFTSHDGGWHYYHFDIYINNQMLGYNYKNNPYQDTTSHLVSVQIRNLDYSEVEYIFPVNNNIKNLPDTTLKIDTSLYDIRHVWKRFMRQDTLFESNDTDFRDSSTYHSTCYYPSYSFPIGFVFYDDRYNKKYHCESTNNK